MPRKQKGQSFEREMCRTLSLWWSKGKRDDLVWRTSGSGARATVRAKKGKTTANHHGDLCATDASIQPLFDLILFELKCGYSSRTVSDFLDTKNPPKDSLPTWIEKLKNSAKESARPYWVLFHKRVYREVLVYLPSPLAVRLGATGGPNLGIFFEDWEKGNVEYIMVILLKEFLKINPEEILSLHKQLRQKKNK